MKRKLSFLIAAIMILSLLPAMNVTAATDNTIVVASSTVAKNHSWVNDNYIPVLQITKKAPYSAWNTGDTFNLTLTNANWTIDAYALSSSNLNIGAGISISNKVATITGAVYAGGIYAPFNIAEYTITQISNTRAQVMLTDATGAEVGNETTLMIPLMVVVAGEGDVKVGISGATGTLAMTTGSYAFARGVERSSENTILVSGGTVMKNYSWVGKTDIPLLQIEKKNIGGIYIDWSNSGMSFDLRLINAKWTINDYASSTSNLNIGTGIDISNRVATIYGGEDVTSQSGVAYTSSSAIPEYTITQISNTRAQVTLTDSSGANAVTPAYLIIPLMVELTGVGDARVEITGVTGALAITNGSYAFARGADAAINPYIAPNDKTFSNSVDLDPLVIEETRAGSIDTSKPDSNITLTFPDGFKLVRDSAYAELYPGFNPAQSAGVSAVYGGSKQQNKAVLVFDISGMDASAIMPGTIVIRDLAIQSTTGSTKSGPVYVNVAATGVAAKSVQVAVYSPKGNASPGIVSSGIVNSGGSTGGGNTGNGQPTGTAGSMEIGAGSVDTNGNTTTTTMNQESFDAGINSSAGNLIVNMAQGTDVSEMQMTLKNVEDMNSNATNLIVRTENVQYELPATAVDNSSILEALGATDASAVAVSITISTNLSPEVEAIVNNAISASGGEIVFPPVEFKVTASYNDNTMEINTFNQYVSRSVEITPEQAAMATTAVVIDPDGTVRHVPTRIYEDNGKWYAEINSLTNSTYAIVHNKKTFADVKDKWYENVANEMISRNIIPGSDGDIFAGERDITRAEFADMIVRALGLPVNGDGTVFGDVPATASYSGAAGTAYEYGLFLGNENKEFEPNRRITRQEAMAVMRRTAAVIGFEGSSNSIDAFVDAGSVSGWAVDAARFNVGSGLITGSGGALRPMDNITRAEAATVALRLLQKAKLLDVRAAL